MGRTKSKLQRVASDIGAARCLVHAADVSKEDEVAGVFEAISKRFDRLDTLVNNAGVANGGPTTEQSLEDWRRLMAINVDGVFLCARAALPMLLRTRGSIVNVSSVSGTGGDWYKACYNASKGAVTNFTRSLALEYGPKGVRINAVNPSLTWSEMTNGMRNNQELMDKFEERIPLGRAAEPQEVAAAIAFLASNDALFINGVNLPVDGGVSASNGQPAMT